MKTNGWQLGWLIAFALSTLLLLPYTTLGQDARVNRVTVTTAEGLFFSAWVNKQTVSYGKDILVNFSLNNRSSKAVFLVRDNTSKIVIERDSIVIPRPFVLIGGHEDYDFSFTRVAAGATYQGHVAVSQKDYQTAQEWRLDLGLGYIHDIRGLNKRLRDGEDPAPYKARLRDRLTTLQLCGVWVKVLDTQ